MGTRDRLAHERGAIARLVAQCPICPIQGLLVSPRPEMGEGNSHGESPTESIERAQPHRPLECFDRSVRLAAAIVHRAACGPRLPLGPGRNDIDVPTAIPRASQPSAPFAAPREVTMSGDVTQVVILLLGAFTLMLLITLASEPWKYPDRTHILSLIVAFCSADWYMSK